MPADVVAFGALMSDDGQVVDGYAYFIDSQSEAEVRGILSQDPLVKGKLEAVTFVSRWRRAFGVHQSIVPANKDNATGLLFLGFGKPNIHSKRDTLVQDHLQYLAEWDKQNIIARGALLAPDQDVWVGSVIALELPSIEAFHRYADSEPFVLGGLYERTIVKPWVRATFAAGQAEPSDRLQATRPVPAGGRR
jgi:uncharacterized protein YciI